MRSFEELDNIMSGAAHYADAAPKPARSFEELDKMMSQEQPKEHTIGERVGQLARGFIQGTGQMSDIANKYLVPGVLQSNQAQRYMTPEKYESEKEMIGKISQDLQKSNLGEELPQRFEQAVGRELKPTEEDTLGKVIHGAGEFLAPPWLGTPGGKTIAGKVLGQVVPAVTASAAVHATPKLAEEGTIGGTVEDISKAILGGMAGGKTVHKLTGPKAEIAKDIEKLASQGRFKPVERIKEKISSGITKISSGITKTGGKILSIGAKEPEARGFGLAAKHGVELPYNIGMGSRVQNFMANNVLNKSIFVSQAYKETMKKANEDMIDAVRKSISHLGDSNYKPETASNKYAEFFKKEENSFTKQVSELYDNARSSLTDSDKVIPSHTAKYINSAFMQKLLKVPSKEEGTRKVVGSVGDIAKKWGLLPENINLDKLGDITQSNLSQLMKKMEKTKMAVPVDELVLQRAELLKMNKYDKSVRGMKKNLSRLASEIDKDIESSTNREFISKWRGANNFLKTNMENRFKTDITRSILSGKAPTYAFDNMDSKQNIEFLKKALGDSPEAEKIFKDLSSAKLRQILEPVLEEGLKEGSSLRTGAMVRLFSKGEGKQEILEALVGKDAYNKLEEIAEISSLFSKAGKDVLNTSGTAIAASEMDKLTKLSAGAICLLFGAGFTKTAGTAAAYVGSVNLLSRLASNKRFINEARNYAIARSKGQEKQARSILNRLIDTAKKEQQSLKFAATEAISKSAEEENE